VSCELSYIGILYFTLIVVSPVTTRMRVIAMHAAEVKRYQKTVLDSSVFRSRAAPDDG